MAEIRETTPAAAALRTRLGNASFADPAHTPGDAIASVLGTQARLVEYISHLEPGAHTAYFCGIAWRYGPVYTTLPMQTLAENDTEGWIDVFWRDRTDIVLSAASSLLGPTRDPLALCEHLLGECLRAPRPDTVCDTWWPDGTPDDDGTHEVCEHQRAVAALLRLMPPPLRATTEAMLALRQPAQAAAAIWLSRQDQFARHPTCTDPAYTVRGTGTALRIPAVPVSQA